MRIPSVRLISYTPDGERPVAAASKRSLSSRDISEIFERMGEGEVETWISETLRGAPQRRDKELHSPQPQSLQSL